MSDPTWGVNESDAAFERRLILQTQEGLPLTLHPYRTIADQLGVSEQQVMATLTRLTQNGVVRRIAAIPNQYRLGYSHNAMTVWDVDDAHIDRLGECVSALDGVSHCYHRPRALPAWPYNLFAMIHCQSAEDMKREIAVIRDCLGVHCRSDNALLSTRILKKTGVRLAMNSDGKKTPRSQESQDHV